MVQNCHQKALMESLVQHLRSAAAIATLSSKQAVVPLKAEGDSVSSQGPLPHEGGPELDPDVCGRDHTTWVSY